MKPPMFSNEQTCKLFRCSHEQITRQYGANAQQLHQMHEKAVQTGKKVNGYTAGQLKVLADRFDDLAKA